jgi:hypothetical protein
MRVYIRVPAAVALELIEDGFRDMHHDQGEVGVWCYGRPPDGIEGPEGDTVLCGEVPEEVFREREAQESTQSLTKDEAKRMYAGGPEPEGLEYQRMGYAIIPAEVLIRHGKPRVYDHDYAGSSRRELVQAIRVWEADRPEGLSHAQEMRSAVEFFDRIGWLTPLKLREEREV